jgi:phage shock protein A
VVRPTSYRAASALSRKPTRYGCQQAADGEHLTFERMRSKVTREEALGRAKGELLGDDIDGRLHALEREQKIDALLEEIKAKKGLRA